MNKKGFWIGFFVAIIFVFLFNGIDSGNPIRLIIALPVFFLSLPYKNDWSRGIGILAGFLFCVFAVFIHHGGWRYFLSLFNGRKVIMPH